MPYLGKPRHDDVGAARRERPAVMPSLRYVPLSQREYARKLVRLRGDVEGYVQRLGHNRQLVRANLPSVRCKATGVGNGCGGQGENFPAGKTAD